MTRILFTISLARIKGLVLAWLTILLLSTIWSAALADEESVAYEQTFTGNNGTGNLSSSITTYSTTRGVIVFVVQNSGATDEVTGVTCGGVAMTEVCAPATKAGGESGAVYAYFLGNGIPVGTPTILVSVNATGSQKVSNCYTIAAQTTTTEIQGFDRTSINSTALDNPNALLSSNGRACWVSQAFHTGQNTVTTGCTKRTNWAESREFDFGTQGAGFYAYNLVDALADTIGWLQSSDDALCIAIAITEGPIAVKDTVSTAMDYDIGWSRNLNRALQQSDGRHVLVFGEDSSVANANFKVATAATMGSTWTISARLIDDVMDNESYAMGWSGDVVYPMNNIIGTLDIQISEIVNGAIGTMTISGDDTRDTILTTNLAAGQAFYSGGWTGGSDTVYALSASATANYPSVYYSQGDLNNTWVKGDSVNIATSTLGTMCWSDGPGNTAIGIAQSSRDMYVIRPLGTSDGLNVVQPVDIIPSSFINNVNHWTFSSHKSDGSDSLYFLCGAVTGAADSALWLYRLQYYRNGGIDSVRILDSVIIASENKKPTLTGTTDTCAFRPFVFSNATNLAQVGVGFCIYPDTAQRDSVDIVYRLSSDTGKTFDTAITIYNQAMKATDVDAEQRVLKPISAQHFYKDTAAVYFHNGTADPVPLFVVRFAVKQPSSGAIPRRRRAGQKYFGQIDDFILPIEASTLFDTKEQPCARY